MNYLKTQYKNDKAMKAQDFEKLMDEREIYLMYLAMLTECTIRISKKNLSHEKKL